MYRHSGMYLAAADTRPHPLCNADLWMGNEHRRRRVKITLWVPAFIITEVSRFLVKQHNSLPEGSHFGQRLKIYNN